MDPKQQMLRSSQDTTLRCDTGPELAADPPCSACYLVKYQSSRTRESIPLNNKLASNT